MVGRIPLKDVILVRVQAWQQISYTSEMITIDDFEKIDIRLGKIIEVQDFPEARKPAFKLTIDLGPEIGIKRSSVQLVGTYKKEELLGLMVSCVVNFPPRQVGPFISEVLTLGYKNTDGEGYVLVTPSKSAVLLGDRLS
jgi:tRNA-binding protein